MPLEGYPGCGAIVYDALRAAMFVRALHTEMMARNAYIHHKKIEGSQLPLMIAVLDEFFILSGKWQRLAKTGDDATRERLEELDPRATRGTRPARGVGRVLGVQAFRTLLCSAAPAVTLVTTPGRPYRGCGAGGPAKRLPTKSPGNAWPFGWPPIREDRSRVWHHRRLRCRRGGGERPDGRGQSRSGSGCDDGRRCDRRERTAHAQPART